MGRSKTGVCTNVLLKKSENVKLIKRTLVKALKKLVLGQDLIVFASWDFLADYMQQFIKKKDALNANGEFVGQGQCYCKYKNLKVWKVINEAILSLLTKKALLEVTVHNLVVGFIVRELDTVNILHTYREVSEEIFTKILQQGTTLDEDGCRHWDVWSAKGIKMQEVDYDGKIIWKRGVFMKNMRT